MGIIYRIICNDNKVSQDELAIISPYLAAILIGQNNEHVLNNRIVKPV